jgi:CubicO group peptidase (beta-lactamase class C family)
MTKRIFLLLTLASVALSAFTQKTLEELTSTYQEALKQWDVPGMAVAIIKNDSLILSEGFGISNVQTGAKVDDETLFAIASNTKAFTATAIGLLVEDGKLSWDDKVVDHLPWFELYAPYVTAHMTVRDLLCHRSGLKTFSGDLLWYGSDYSRKEIVKRARHLEPANGFREKFGYSNIMYLAAGLVVEEVSGMSWDNFLQKHFFNPLQMNRTVTSTLKLEEMDNIAAPHNNTDNGIIAIDYLNWDNVAPAGSIISNVKDLSKWVKTNLHYGIYGSDTIFSPSTAMEMWKQHTPLPVSSYSKKLWPSTHLKSYGLGWSMYDYHGEKIVTHNGGYDGMISQTVLVPEKKSGFVILTNSLSRMYYPLLYETLDFLLDEEPQYDWSEYFLEQNTKYEERMKQMVARQDSLRQKDTKPSLSPEKYAGAYSGDLYGEAQITLKKDGTLNLQMVPSPKFHSKLTHWHHDTFMIKFEEFPSLPRGWVTFVLDRNGKVHEMKIDVQNPEFDFTELKFIKQ